MLQSFMLSLRGDALLIEIVGRRVAINSIRGNLVFDDVGLGLLEVLRTLSSGGGTLDELTGIVRALDGPSGLAPLKSLVDECLGLCLLRHTLLVDGEPVAIIEPMAPGFEIALKAIEPTDLFQISRFAYCRREGCTFLLESPLSVVRMLLPGHVGAGIVAELAQPRTLSELCLEIDCLQEEAVRTFVGLLNCARFAISVNDSQLTEDDDLALAQWEFHDLLFHSRSRTGNHDYAVGGVYPFLQTIPPLPAVKPPATGRSLKILPLFKPDLDRLRLDDAPFADILERRRSIRDYSKTSITAKQLGEFLFRGARVRRIMAPEGARRRHYEISDRPYPSAGAAYDLELYITINRCDGIVSGIYHYDPLGHQLVRISEFNEDAVTLIRSAQFAAALTFRPQVLITITSRFQRLSWKYRGLSYAATLKNVGVLYQTMYLVATAMQLAPCALGKGDSHLFAEATGISYLSEASVGEFVLGSVPIQDVNTGSIGVMI